MKVKLIYASGEPQSEWTNICPFGEDGCITASLDKLDEHICDGEVQELHALDVIEYYTYEKMQEMLGMWGRKLAKGGILLISFDDIFLLTKQFANGLPLKEFCEAIHGKQDKPRNFKRCSVTINQIIEIVGLKVLKKRLIGTKIFLEFQK